MGCCPTVGGGFPIPYRGGLPYGEVGCSMGCCPTMGMGVPYGVLPYDRGRGGSLFPRGVGCPMGLDCLMGLGCPMGMLPYDGGGGSLWGAALWGPPHALLPVAPPGAGRGGAGAGCTQPPPVPTAGSRGADPGHVAASVRGGAGAATGTAGGECTSLGGGGSGIGPPLPQSLIHSPPLPRSWCRSTRGWHPAVTPRRGGTLSPRR